MRQPLTERIAAGLEPGRWFTVTLDAQPDDFSAWESAELAFAEADHLKRDYGPAVIRDRTGDAA